MANSENIAYYDALAECPLHPCAGKFMPATIVILPTWNEAENLPRMVAALLALPLECLRVLVVDDNSPDGTGQLADELARQHPDRVSVLHRARREGYGPATMAGFMAALQTDATCIVQMDCDFSHQPRYLPDLIARTNNADLVIGSRYIPGGSVDANWSLPRKLLSWWANSVYVRLLLNLPVRDATGGFRLWRRETLTGLELEQIRSNGYVFQVEMICMAYYHGYRIAEVPIHFPDRVAGESKMGAYIALEAARNVWQLRQRYRRRRPG